MKSFVLALAALSFAAGAASAMTSHSGLTASDITEAKRLAPTVELDNLTTAQAAAIQSIIYSDSEARGAQIRAIVLN